MRKSIYKKRNKEIFKCPPSEAEEAKDCRKLGNRQAKWCNLRNTQAIILFVLKRGESLKQKIW